MENLNSLLNSLINCDQFLHHLINERKTIASPNEVLGNLRGLRTCSTLFLGKRDELKASWIETSTFSVADEKKLKMLRAVRNNEQFLADRIAIALIRKSEEERKTFKGLGIVEGQEPPLESFIIEEWAEKLFHDEFGPCTWAGKLLDIGILTLHLPLPRELSKFVDEARMCFAFYQYNAVYSLCRTILETAMRDAGVRSGKVQPPEDPLDFFREYPLKYSPKSGQVFKVDLGSARLRKSEAENGTKPQEVERGV